MLDIIKLSKRSSKSKGEDVRRKAAREEKLITKKNWLGDGKNG
jgi:hypothetical protein